MSEWIALGSLGVAALGLIVGFVMRSKAAAARDQLVLDKLDNIDTSVNGVKTTVDNLDRKTDDHSVRIARLEGEVDNAYRRIDRIEGRCDRHFGVSKHD